MLSEYFLIAYGIMPIYFKYIKMKILIADIIYYID